MPFISLNKATDPTVTDYLRINTAAVLYVEASRPGRVGKATIHMLGQTPTVNALTDSIAMVMVAIFDATCPLVACTRHYLAKPPEQGPSTVYVSPTNVSYMHPNLPVSPDFWTLRFADGSELRVLHPLPDGL